MYVSHNIPKQSGNECIDMYDLKTNLNNELALLKFTNILYAMYGICM